MNDLHVMASKNAEKARRFLSPISNEENLKSEIYYRTRSDSAPELRLFLK
jgi:hypothetical protein